MTTMHRDALRTFFDASPTARLLRSDLAPLVIDFLNRTFKAGESISIGQTELRVMLATYQEELHEIEPEVMRGPPQRYATQWAENGWLSRFLEASSIEPQYQLTRYAEEAIRFVDSTLSKGNSLVGTESRLRLVIETLEDIVRGASADPNRRLEYLKLQRVAIDEEIAAIEAGKSVQVYRPSQIRERFQTAIDLLKALQSDFRAVEERFQSITRDVQQQQSTGDKTRGGILGFALDSEDLLKQQDEGISFFAFVAFLFSPTQQAALRKNIEEVQQLSALAEEHESLQHVRRMIPALLAEADKVMKTTARLSGTLRRLLDAQAAAHRVRLANVLRDIKQAALELRGQPPADGVLSLSADAGIASPLARTFWKPRATFDPQTPEEHVVDLSALRDAASALARLTRLDFRRLRRTIRDATYQGNSVRLATLLESTPVTGGVVELLGYLQIAHDDKHEIDSTLIDTICILETRHRDRSLRVRVPRVTFNPKAVTTRPGRRPK
ncbi:hypothetical protein Q31a_62920 [Aureliella helgolandensis]|uniref:DUF3375 domain-containing protein n=2 Tax=Aureliella helgolandensis TaxID=2527968 RepID=A0A518GH39_9BACT|nr:hypothetical protein Q31a_62920 [Aureliella helgolandensis]